MQKCRDQNVQRPKRPRPKRLRPKRPRLKRLRSKRPNRKVLFSFVTMVPWVLGFISSGNANYFTELYHAWRFGDRFFFTFHCCRNDQNITVSVSERTSLGAVITLLALSTTRWKTDCFLSRAPAFFLKRTSLFFAKITMQTFVPLHLRFSTRAANEINWKKYRVIVPLKNPI